MSTASPASSLVMWFPFTVNPLVGGEALRVMKNRSIYFFFHSLYSSTKGILFADWSFPLKLRHCLSLVYSGSRVGNKDLSGSNPYLPTENTDKKWKGNRVKERRLIKCPLLSWLWWATPMSQHHAHQVSRALGYLYIHFCLSLLEGWGGMEAHGGVNSLTSLSCCVVEEEFSSRIPQSQWRRYKQIEVEHTRLVKSKI